VSSLPILILTEHQLLNIIYQHLSLYAVYSKHTFELGFNRLQFELTLLNCVEV